MPPAYCTVCNSPVDRDHVCPENATPQPAPRRRRGRHRAPGRVTRLGAWFGGLRNNGKHTAVPGGAHVTKPAPVVESPAPRPQPTRPARQSPPARPSPVTPAVPVGTAAVAAPARKYRLPVMELLGLSDTAELTITLPATPTDDLSIDLHATTLVVAPPDDDVTIAPPDDEADEEWEAVPSRADVSADEEADTGVLIGKLWEATEDSLILEEEWTPQEPESESRSRLAWWIAGGVALVVGLIAAVWMITDNSTRSTADLRTDYGQVSGELRQATGQVAQVLGPMTNLDVESSQLSDAAAALADMEAAARRASSIAAEAIPTGPFQEADPDMEPMRANLRTGAERSSELQLRLANVLTYRMLLDRSFLLPPLPYAITQDNIPALGVEISLAIANTTEAVEQLPRDPALASHRQQVINLAQRLETWQVEYLAAVRNDNLEETSVLIEEFETEVAEIRSSLAQPLESVANSSETEIAYVLAALDRIEDLLTDG